MVVIREKTMVIFSFIQPLASMVRLDRTVIIGRSLVFAMLAFGS